MAPDFRQIEANGLIHRVAVAGEGPLVMLVHGFPESWYSWRHQIDALAAAGYRAAAPDVRGYGGSGKPHPVEAYDMETITGDMAALAGVLSPDAPAVIVGHDWGAPIAWTSALLHPGRFRAVAGLSVPHLPPGQMATLDLYHQLFTDQGKFFYQVYFQDEGGPEAELEADPAATIRRFCYAVSGDCPEGTWPTDKRHGARLLDGLPEPAMPLPWLSEADVAYYAGEFARSGFRGPLNRYRNSHRDHAFLSVLDSHVIDQPSLFIGGTRDLVLKMLPVDLVDLMKPHLADLRGLHMLEGCGHWTQQERPDPVSHLLIDWLGAL